MAVLLVLGGGTLLASQVRTDLDQTVGERARDAAGPDGTPPLKLNEFALPSDLPMEIPRGTQVSPDLSKLTLPSDMDIQIPNDLDLSGLELSLPPDFRLELPEGTIFSPPGLELPNGGTIRLPDGRALSLPPGSKVDLPPELVERLLAQGVPAGRLHAPRSIDVRDLPPDATARIDPPQFDGAGRMRLPAGTEITLPDGRRFPFPAGALAYGARYLLPAGTTIDIPIDDARSRGGPFPVPRPNSSSQLVDPAHDPTLPPLVTEITQMPERVRKGEPVTVSGFVRDSAGRPVAGAPVDVFMNETKRAPGVLVGQGVSDENGIFTIALELPADKPAREYQLVNHAVPFTDASGKRWGDGWGDPPFATYASTTMTLDLPARDGLGSATPIAGMLLDHTGVPVVGVGIPVSVAGSVVGRPVTDVQGRFVTTHTFPPGTHEVEARFLGNAHYDATSARGTISIEDYAIEVGPTVRGAPGDTILLSGRVLGKGAAAPEQAVTISYFGMSVGVTSDSTGRFSYAYATPPSLAAGVYRVRYALPEHDVERTQLVELTLAGRLSIDAPTAWDSETPLAVAVSLGSVSPRAPIPGQAVRLTMSGPGGTSEAIVVTDAGGGATAHLRPLRPMPGTYTITARVADNPHIDAPAVSTNVALAPFEVLWSMPSTVVRGEEASGAVTVLFAGRPYAGASVTLDFFGAMPLVTDATGRSTWSAKVPGHAPLGQQPVRLITLDHPERTTVTTVVALPKLEIDAPAAYVPGEPVTASVRLRDDQGAPLRDHRITLLTSGANGTTRTDVRTDGNGDWRGALEVPSEGEVTLSARVEPEGPYLGADSARTMSATTSAPATSRALWLIPLVVGLAALAGGGAWYATRRSRQAAPVAAAAAPGIAAVPRKPAELELRFAIPEGEPPVWGIGEPLPLVVRNLGAAGDAELEAAGARQRIRLDAGSQATRTLAFDEEGEIVATCARVGAADTEPARASLRIVDYRKETAREFDLFLEKARRVDGALSRHTTPREIAWTLAGRLGEGAESHLDEIALVMEITNYSHYEVARGHYLRFVRAARALDSVFGDGR